MLRGAAAAILLSWCWSTAPVAAVTSDGSLDPGFGSSGAVSLPLSGEPAYRPVTEVLTDGSIITQTATNGWLRITADGTVDSDFPARLSTALNGAQLQLFSPAPTGGARVLAASYSSPESQVPDQFRLIGIKADGSIDPGFADAGRSTPIPSTGTATSLEIGSGGSWVVMHQESRYDPTIGFRESCVIRRMTPDGALDPTFGAGGESELHLVYPVGRGPACSKALPTASGHIVMLDGVLGILRLTPSGAVDPTWNNGQPAFPLTFGTERVALSGDKVLAGGTTFDNGIGFRFAITQLTDSGIVDPTFGTAGRIVLSFADLQPPITPSPNNDALTGLIVQPDGSALAIGSTEFGVGVARISITGSLDSTFGTGGRSVISPPPSFPDGRGQQPGTGAWDRGRVYLRSGATLLAVTSATTGPPAVVPEGKPLALAVMAIAVIGVAGLVLRRRRPGNPQLLGP
jgi:uncharacterized delta-60 repeat protein